MEEKDTFEIAERIYELATDMDFADYEKTKEKDIKEIEQAIYHLKTIAENGYNSEYWRTFYKALQRI